MTEGLRAYGQPLGWAKVEEKLGEVMPGYQPREPQQKLADFMAKSLGSENISGAFCQAPTGTGKSFPLLVSLIDDALSRGRVNLAATATKALQDQYIRDLEFLKTQVYEGGFDYALLKGRSNYVCRAKLAKFDEALYGLKVDEIIEQSADPEVNGDVDRLQMDISSRARSELTMSANECPGKKNCKFGEICFAEVAKKRASEAHIVVVNHAMVATDAVLNVKYGYGMLPNYEVIGVDEAHELAEYVEGALTTEVSERQINNLIHDSCDWLEEQNLIPDGSAIVGKLYAKLRTVLDQERTITLTPAMVMELTEIVELTKFLGSLSAKMAAKRASGDDEVLKKARLRKRVANAAEMIQDVIMADFADIVRWLELDEYMDRGQMRGRGVLLCMAPVKVAEFMNNAIWSRARPLLTSATLATGGKFDYMADQVGMTLTDQPYETFDCESPFNYTEQARTYIAQDIPNPRQSSAGHRAGVNAAIISLVEAAQGRTLSLFTSREGLNRSFDACAPAIENMGYRVLRQGDMPTRKLAEVFKEDRHSVLFATKSFFTGVDVQGESLSLLTLDKCPFHVPTVVWKARCDALDAKVGNEFWHGSFSKMMLPDMIITLMQAYGRLIRSVTDKGLVAILDPAIAPGGPKYGTTVRNSLPPAPIVYSLAEAVAFAKTIPVTPDIEALPDLGELEEETV